MSNECNEHPENFDGYSPQEFTEKFVKTNYFFQKEVYRLLPLEYLKEAEGDKNRTSLKNPKEKRKQLASGLEKLAKIFEIHVSEAIKGICNSCKKYLKNPYE